MPRPIWKGQISFGLVNIPVTLYPAVERTELHFHLLDSRDMGHIRYERVNEETGAEVPWNEVVKGYEYEKNNYVVVKDEELKRIAVESTQTINIENFVAAKDLDCIYFDKPYYLIPEKKTEKGYVLLREALRNKKAVGIAKVVIRTRQYLTAIMPYRDGLLLNLLHFAQEFRDIKNFDLPSGKIEKYKISKKELQIAEDLIAAMTDKWNPKKYHDDYRENLMAWIHKKVKAGKTNILPPKEEEPAPTKIIDFMKLLKKSVEQKSKKTSAKATSKKQPHKILHRKH